MSVSSIARQFRGAVAVLSGMAALSAAQSTEASFTAVTTVNTGSAQVVNFSYNGTAVNAYATAFQTTLYNASGTAVSGVLNTYCVDVVDELQNKETVNINSVSNLAGGYANYVGSLYANFAASATSSVDQAALQLAIWHTEYDGPGINNSGPFVLNSAPQAVINQALYYMQNNTLVANSTSYLQVVSGTAGQSLIGPSLNSNGSPNVSVPEPASVAMMGIGLVTSLGVAARRRRTRGPVVG